MFILNAKKLCPDKGSAVFFDSRIIHRGSPISKDKAKEIKFVKGEYQAFLPKEHNKFSIYCQLGTTEFGNFLIELATKYNDALLVVENNNIGWATLQTIIDRGYENLFYQEKNHLIVDEDIQHTNKYRNIDRNKIPGFTTTMKSKPLIQFCEYL